MSFTLRAAGLAVLCVAAAQVAIGLQDHPRFPTPLFFAATVVSAWFGGAGAGVLAAVLGTILLDYFEIPPAGRLSFAKPESFQLIVFAVPALFLGWFAGRLRNYQEALRRARDELDDRLREGTAELRTTNAQLQAQIAERLRAEEAVQKTQAELAHVARVMTMGEWAAAMAHEVNTPLMSVVINADASLRWLDGDHPNLPEARDAIGRIIEEGNRAADVVRRVRALVKKTTPRRSALDLNEVIGEVLTLLEREFVRSKVTLKAELAPSLPRVTGDRVQVQQVVLNLVVNAIEAMLGQSGKTRLLTLRSETDEGGMVQVSVEDSGPGLPGGVDDQVFTAFYTTKPEGMGMGLSISRTIVESFGGRLWAANSPRGGAIFQFRLPATAEKI